MDNWGNLIKECTRSLRDDPELELDVAAELRGHLEDKCTELTDGGMTDAEAQTAAMKAFGEPEDIAASLQEANFRRMKLRSRVRLILKLAVIPMTLLALWFAVDFRLLRAFNTFSEIQESLDGKQDGVMFRLENKISPPSYLSGDDKLIFFGDLSQKGNYRRQKAIWERFPDNKAFLSNYINQMEPKNYLQEEELSFQEKITELESAKKLDPDNAYYNYRLCYLYLEKADGIKWVSENPAKNGVSYLTASIGDRKMLDLAMKEFAEGVHKPYCHSYINEMIQLRKSLFHSELDFAGIFDDIYIYYHTSRPSPVTNIYRNVARIVPFYAGVLLTEGKTKEAQFYLNAWLPMARQINNDSHNSLDMMLTWVIMAVQKNIFMRDVLAQQYLKGTALNHRLETAIRPLDEWTQQRKNKPNPSKYDRYAASCNSLFPIPWDFMISPEFLDPPRLLEYCLAEKISLGIIGVIITALMVFFSVNAAWRFFHGQRGFLLLPNLYDGIKILFYGLLLPLLFYFMVTRLNVLSGRECNIWSNRMLTGWQIGFLIVGIPAIFMAVYGRWLGRRCRELEIDLPRKRIWIMPTTTAAVVLAIMGIVANNLQSTPKEVYTLILWTCGLCGLPVVAMIVQFSFLKEKFKDYKTVFYVGMIPALGIFLLLLTMTIRPYLDYREHYYISKISSVDSAVPPLERRMVEALRAKTAAALDEAEKIK